MKDCCYIRVSDFKIPPNELFCQSSLSETIDFTGFIYATKPLQNTNFSWVSPACRYEPGTYEIIAVKVKQFFVHLPSLTEPFSLPRKVS